MRSERDGNVVYRFDIKLQGEDEMIFFDVCFEGLASLILVGNCQMPSESGGLALLVHLPAADPRVIKLSACRNSAPVASAMAGKVIHDSAEAEPERSCSCIIACASNPCC
jgi:hypothetical protein